MAKRVTGSSNFLSPADHMSAKAILVEPIKLLKDQESTYQGKTRIRDEGVADFTIFGTQESVDTGVPTDILKAHKVGQKVLAREIGENIGEQLVCVLKKVPMGEGTGYVFRSKEEDVSNDTFAKVEAYIEKRDAEVQSAMDDAPDFGDDD